MNARAGILMALLLTAPALAADDRGRASDRALAPLVVCRPIPDSRARAACYDAALDKLQQSVADRNIVVMDREQVKEDRKANFGFGANQQLARVASPKAPKAARVVVEDVAEVDSTVVSAAAFGYDRLMIRLANGATWRTTEPGLATPPKAGTAIHISRGVMGGFMMRIGRARAVRALRVN